MIKNISADRALERLMQGNGRYLLSGYNDGDISPEIRKATVEGGQHPYAVVLTCSDSRVIPEVIFSAGIGELFVIRVAGNIVGASEAASIEYATAHLGANLVMILGHDHCGAVEAALSENRESGIIANILDEIALAAQGEADPDKVCELNVKHGVKKARALNLRPDVKVIGAVYNTASGEVNLVKE